MSDTVADPIDHLAQLAWANLEQARLIRERVRSGQAKAWEEILVPRLAKAARSRMRLSVKLRGHGVAIRQTHERFTRRL